MKNKVKHETREEATIRLITDPNSWPHWPLLPLINRGKRDPGGMPLNGCLVACLGTEDDPYNVFHTNLFMFNPQATKEVYETPEDILNAGWLVD